MASTALSAAFRIPVARLPLATSSTAGAVPGLGSEAPEAALAAGQFQAAIYGVGNLRGWFDRQFFAHTNSTTSDANKRVSIMQFGDSLSGRLTGWFSYYASKEFNFGGQNGGFGNNTGPIYLEPTGPGSSGGGSVHTYDGDAALITNGFVIWPNGIYHDVGPGASVIFPSETGRSAELWKTAYVAEPDGPTAVIEIASSLAGPWTQMGDALDAANATQIGVVASRETGTLSRRFVRVRNTGATRLKVISAYHGYATSTRGWDGMAMSQGGIAPSSSALASPAIYTPILTDLDPALFTVHFDDQVAAFEANWPALLAIMRAGNPTRSILVIANGPHSSSGGDAGMSAAMRFFRSRVVPDNIAVGDMMSLLTSFAETEAQGWQGDNIHLNQRAYAYGAQRFWAELSIGTRLGILFSERGSFSERLSTPELRFENAPGSNLFATGQADDYYVRIVADTQLFTGARLETGQRFSITNKANTETVAVFSVNEAQAPNRFAGRSYRPNVSSQTIPAAYNSLNTGVLEWTSGNKRVLRDQATEQVLRVGPYTGEASLDYAEIAAGAEATLTVTVTGVTTAGKFAVSLGWSAALEDGIIVKQVWVSGTNTVSVRVANVTTGAINPVAVTAYVVAQGIQ